MNVHRFLTSAVSLLLVLCFVPMLRAQDNTATLTGVVTDSTGAAIPDVQVTLTNPQTDTTYRTVTNGTGSYTFTEVKPGPGYTLVLERQGFQKEEIAGLYLNIAATRTQNAQMNVGQTQETVTVSAASQTVTLDTTDATVGNNFQVDYLEDLPIADRSNPSALFTQQPGMALDGAATGARTDQDRVTLDGLDVNDMATGLFGIIVGNAPVDSVQEFRGMVAGALSTSGPGGGGQFDLVTKSGSNAFHGDAAEYHRDTDLEANTWFNNNAGVGRAPLIRNQFGGALGGPIVRDRAYFYFDYNGRRDTLSNVVNQTVPLDSFRNQTITYGNSSGGTSTMSAQQAAALDPQGIGWNAQLLNVFSTRYPHSNNLQVGDGLNTGGFEFNAPFPYTENDFVGRVDYTINQKMKMDGVGHWTRTNGTNAAIQFPGDPETHPFLDQSYSWVVGHTWTLSTSKINQAYGGIVYESYNFPNSYNPTGVTQWETFGGNGTGGIILTAPYGTAINAQGRSYPIPMIRDNFTWIHGSHSFTFGGTFKWPSPVDYTILNYNTPTLGLGGYTPSLAVPTGTPSLRPSDIGSGNATALYDAAYALALAPITENDATYYYNSSLSAIPQGTAQTHHYKYKEVEGYFSDTWKVKPSLTLTWGLQYQFFSVPYDSAGIESIPDFYNTSQKFDFTSYFGDRLSQSAQGLSGNLAIPLIQYVLGGKANNGPNYYQPQYDNLAPKFAFAWNPSFDRTGVWSGGAAIVYDQTVINAVQYQESQYSYLFQASNPVPYGTVGNAYTSLQSDQRFGGFSAPPPAPSAPTVTQPYLPYVVGTGTNATPFGLANGLAFNEIIDPQLKTPYSIQYNFGYQHQFPQGYLLRMTYVGRLGRRLLAQVDANQLVDFPDTKSGQTMAQAFANISLEARNNQQITTQPWYEDVLPPGVGAANGFPSNTAWVANAIEPYVERGDFADTTEALSGLGVLPPNVGMAAQFSEDTFYTNQGFSSYNGLLTTLHKNLGYGLQFDVNYTWSHSIDNVSVIANAPALAGYGFICDETHPRECRANSDFGIRNVITGNFVYTLPVGRGQLVGSTMPWWLDEAIGGWEVSGLPSWQTGLPYFAAANAFVAGYANDAPALLTGPISDMKIHLNGGKGNPLYAFRNPTQANADYTGPIGFTIGSRNNLYGPRFSDVDLGLGKRFPIYQERVVLKFRADAFNAFNHPNFDNPTVDITDIAGPFGLVGSGQTNFDVAGQHSSGEDPRVLQGALRVEF
jgi:hypothetical protein